MSAASLPPKTNNGTLNTVFNVSDFATSAYDSKYLKLTGGKLTGGLACQGISTTGITSTSGTNQFNTNISLPTVYNATPNLTFPTSGQLGYGLKTAITTTVAVTGTIQNLLSVPLSTGIYLINYQVRFSPSATGTCSLTSFIAALSTTNSALNLDQRVSNFATQSLLYNATLSLNAASCLIGTCYLQIASATTYYLNTQSTFTTTAGQYDGYVQIIRVG